MAKFTSETGRIYGAKSKRKEASVRLAISDVITEEDKAQFLKAVFKQAKEGDTTLMKEFMYYFFGKPKDTIDIDTKIETIIRVIRNEDEE
jgi:hypothetical protein